MLFNFAGTNGAAPEGGLVQGPEGWLYGCTRRGGSSKTLTDSGSGTVFQFKPATSTFNVIHTFNGTNGAEPRGGLCKASATVNTHEIYNPNADDKMSIGPRPNGASTSRSIPS